MTKNDAVTLIVLGAFALWWLLYAIGWMQTATRQDWLKVVGVACFLAVMLAMSRCFGTGGGSWDYFMYGR